MRSLIKTSLQLQNNAYKTEDVSLSYENSGQTKKLLSNLVELFLNLNKKKDTFKMYYFKATTSQSKRSIGESRGTLTRNNNDINNTPEGDLHN